MKNKLFALSILLFSVSCNVNQKPELLYVDSIKIENSTSSTFIISAEAHFLNPNDIGGQLKSNGIKVFVNDNEIATVSASSFDVPAREQFSIPLRATLPKDSIINSKNLELLLGSLLSKKMKVQYKGELMYTALGFSYAYEVDETQNLNIKL